MIRILLIVIELFVGINAVGGAAYALAGAPGMPREWLKGSPFTSYAVPGLVLLVAVGGSMFAAAGLLLAEASFARTMSVIAGLILVGWIAVQVSIIGRVHVLQPVMMVFGLVVVLLSLLLPSPG